MFVSWAQNFEDVVLRRALADIEQGFWIDVGACEPDAHSVTKAFYDAGWSGINVEPMPASFARLVEARPRDVNLNIAIEDAPGEREYFAVDGGNGMSTGVVGVRERLASEGSSIETVATTVRTLAQVCEEHVTGDIHFLKIDVEGNEQKVIDGADFTRWRPWILLLETTLKPEAGHDSWHQPVLDAGYEFVYFDGINRWYVAEERLAQLRPKFLRPPSIWDDFITAEQWQLQQALDDIARVVGLESGAPTAEVLERVHGLHRDRIRFELEANALRGEVTI